MPKTTVTELEATFDNPEYAKAADPLLGIIRERQVRAGKPDDADTILAIATEILKKRVSA